MNIFEFTSIIWVGSLLAGFLGSLTGLGGGVVIVPFPDPGLRSRHPVRHRRVPCLGDRHVFRGGSGLCERGFHQYAYWNVPGDRNHDGSPGWSRAGRESFHRDHRCDFWNCAHLLRLSFQPARPGGAGDDHPDRLATLLKMDGTYPSLKGPVRYHVHAIPGGFSLMFIAGTLSGLLGIGSGAVKVLAMDRIMRIPFKVSTTTSNFMIGVTAAASAGVYLNRGYIDPGVAMPVMLGVLVGSLLGARMLAGAKTRILRLIFAVVILALGIEMIYNGLTGRL